MKYVRCLSGITAGLCLWLAITSEAQEPTFEPELAQIVELLHVSENSNFCAEAELHAGTRDLEQKRRRLFPEATCVDVAPLR
jgi:hypothetical protein